MRTSNDVVCNIRRLRGRYFLTQDEVVDGANEYLKELDAKPLLDRVSLSKAENGSIILIPDHVFAIATFLDCTMHDIYPEFYPEVPAD